MAPWCADGNLRSTNWERAAEANTTKRYSLEFFRKTFPIRGIELTNLEFVKSGVARQSEEDHGHSKGTLRAQFATAVTKINASVAKSTRSSILSVAQEVFLAVLTLLDSMPSMLSIRAQTSGKLTRPTSPVVRYIWVQSTTSSNIMARAREK